MPTFRITLVAVSLALACTASAPYPIDRRLADLKRATHAAIELPAAATAAIVRTAYQLSFSDTHDHNLNKVSNDTLSKLFDADTTAAFYSADDHIVDDLQRTFTEIERRKIGTEAQAKLAYNQLVVSRRFASANELALRHETLQDRTVPNVTEVVGIEHDKPTELVLDLDAHQLVHRQAQLRSGIQIVVVGNPGCHFSQGASLAIEADTRLRDAFHKYAKWISPANSQIDWSLFSTWNRDHPEQQFTLAYRTTEWPMVMYWGTPSFYFMKDGVVQAQVLGWPGKGRLRELEAAAQSLGLM